MRFSVTSRCLAYSREDIDTIIKPMALDGKEPIGSMGTDVPLAILSDKPQHLSSYLNSFCPGYQPADRSYPRAFGNEFGYLYR
jgi:hypothetical protein